MVTGNGRHSLDDKYLREEGRIILSGVQALVRIPLDQRRADLRAGLDTATLVSGYRGSPLGGYDMLLEANRHLLDAHHVRFLPAVNEDLGATAVFGAQLANLLPAPRYDGVLGIWYGKGPGVDRSGDAFKHANLTGVGRHGGVIAVAGDDPASKSSTVPSASEVALFDAQMPVLFPANVQDVLDLGSAGLALSRYSGLWVGLKMTTNVADEFAGADVGPDRHRWARPAFEYQGRPWQPTQRHKLFPPYNLLLEQEVWEGRLEAARRFGQANGLNRVTVASPGAWLGIAAAGKTYLDVREALSRLGFDEADLARYGIRLLRIGMLYPLDPGTIRQFAEGLEEILVVEEKRSFLELLIRDALFSVPGHPGVHGKYDEWDRPLVPGHGELDADTVAPILAARLARRLPAGLLEDRLRQLVSTLPATVAPLGLSAQRLSYFCSGCPHNRSTVLPDGSLAAAGIGCHGMTAMMDRTSVGFTQMGGEGAQWVGAAPFSGTTHLFQNIGDGTLFHSGSLAIRQAVAAGTSITYKILYNGAVAMTGGQHADGCLSVPDLTRELAAEGVRRTIVVADDVAGYRGVELASGVEVLPRERLDEAQRQLRDIAGVTALIYDQHCAADLRRRRKRGQAPERPMRVLINERICEGCGDCGAKSNCLSVVPVETEFGRKTRIHQSSCNTDYSCLDGDCPAFVTAEPAAAGHRPAPPPLPPMPPLPDPRTPATGHVYMMGIGGTGVVTINQILATGAALEGKSIRCLDQTGLSQKGGAVVSHLKVVDDAALVSNKIGLGDVDAYLGFDVLTAADAKHLARARAGRTVAVISSSRIATGLMVRDPAVAFPAADRLHARIDSVTTPDANVYLDAEGLADRLFGSHLLANMIVVGAACQRGILPVGPGPIEEAIRLNGAAVAANVAAFRTGRAAVADPAWLRAIDEGSASTGAPDPPQAHEAATAARLIDATGAVGEVRRLLAIRVPELMAYQNPAHAARYTAFVARVLAAEEPLGSGSELTEAVARHLFKLMAYKDEYEVARLALAPAFAREAERVFGPGARPAVRLHPPLLRKLGLRRKLTLGPWFRPVLRLLVSLRGLRGTPFDPFGRDAVRRAEQALIGEYRAMIESELTALSADALPRAVALANLPDMIRGYESIKLASIARYRERVGELQRSTPPALVSAGPV